MSCICVRFRVASFFICIINNEHIERFKVFSVSHILLNILRLAWNFKIYWKYVFQCFHYTPFAQFGVNICLNNPTHVRVYQQVKKRQTEYQIGLFCCRKNCWFIMMKMTLSIWYNEKYWFKLYDNSRLQLSFPKAEVILAKF